ncbi:MAG: hypothetical protein ACLQBK_09360 [Candidatus Sulfotelmatobacter sp.]
MADGSRTSAATPLWVRVAMPSVQDLIFVAVLGALVFTPLSVRLLGDAGIGWHIRAGQQILATHMIPRVDSFSSTTGGKPWFAWEWLYDLLVGQLEASLGLNGVVWFTAIVIAAVFAWTFRLLILRGTNVLVALVLVLLAMSASMIHFLARPHVVSWLFTLAWFWILESSEREWFYGGDRQHGGWLWALPLLMLVWVNMHGGFLLGFVLLGIFWAGAMWNWFRTKENRIEELLPRIAAGKRARALAGVGLLSLAASLVNPFGWRLHEHIYSYLSNRFLMDHIDEFRSPDFHGVAQRCFLILLLITPAALAARGRELRMSEVMTVLFAVYAGLYASRNIPVSAVLLVMVMGPLLSPVLSPARLGRGFFQRMSAVESGLRGHVWPILIVVLTFWIAGTGVKLASRFGMNAHFDATRMPVEAVNYLERHELKGPVLSPDYWGGYLIYRLYPATRVVVDDRHDLYGEQFFKSYLKMIRGQPEFGEFLAGRNIGCILLPREAPLATVLLESRRWNVIYRDDTAVAFVSASANQ